MTRLVGSAIARATTALLDADLELAESVIAADEQIDAVQADLEDRAQAVLARQQPVATDLRVIIAGLRMSADLERMGDLAHHVAKLARMRYPASAVPARAARAPSCRWARWPSGSSPRPAASSPGADVALAGELETDDDADGRPAPHPVHGAAGRPLVHGVEAAVDITLCGRYYERFADHAVSVARRVVYLVTGERARPTGG